MKKQSQSAGLWPEAQSTEPRRETWIPHRVRNDKAWKSAGWKNAKQSQFPNNQNCHKFSLLQSLCKTSRPRAREKQSQFQARRRFFHLLHERLPRPLEPGNDVCRRFAARHGGRGGEERSPCLSINGIKALYKPGGRWYYSESLSRCSSMEEHSFRKAEVVGSTPTIGFCAE